MLLSIIIPFYNTGEKVEYLLDSIERECNSNIEIIFVSDGSTDNTDKIIKDKCKNANINHVMLYKTNGGVSSARNLGIANASGQYYMFVDSDDALIKNSMKIILREVSRNSECTLHLFQYVRIHEKNKRQIDTIKISDHVELLSDNKDTLIQKYLDGSLIKLVHLSSCVYKRRFNGDQIFFDESLKYGEDQKYVIDMLLSSNFPRFYFNKTLAYIEYQFSATAKFNYSWFDSVTMLESLKVKGAFDEFCNIINDRINHELISISNNYIKINSISQSTNFIKYSVVNRLKSSNKYHVFILKYLPSFYVISYLIYNNYREYFFEKIIRKR